MYNFFVDKNNILGDTVYVDGGDFNHLKNVLRMKVGDEFLVSENGKNHLCRLSGYEPDRAVAKIIQSDYMDTALSIKISLFQGLPKSDKLEFIIQKAVELGAENIIPVQTTRSVVKIEDKKVESKRQRWQAIAESAAKQCKRSLIPTVYPAIRFKDALKMISDLDLLIVPYESKEGMKDTLDALKQLKREMKVGVFIGAEGGFEDEEIELLKSAGGKIISLGKRILRTETAAITTLSMLMLYSELNLS
ncbi:MAG: 16S rRNA (uracil(1498)-N(3))-methyltransferase [Clostridiales bacterium]|nr:16S rRNA (uracil(1498)-N(3))-methyltransferase [Clostridiales bacterium]